MYRLVLEWYGTEGELTSLAIVSKDANAALGLHVQLLTNSVGDMTSWAVSQNSPPCFSPLKVKEQELTVR